MLTDLLDTYRWQAHVKTCARRGDLEVIFEEGTIKPRTNATQLFLPAPHQMTSHRDKVYMEHFVNHESSHHEYSSDFSLLESDPLLDPQTSFIGAIWNALDDNRVDSHANEEWLGVKENSNIYYSLFMPELIATYKQVVADTNVPSDFRDKTMALLYICLYNEADKIVGIQLHLEEFEKLLQRGAVEYIEKYKAGTYKEQVDNAGRDKEGSRQMADLAKVVAKEVFGIDVKKESKEAKEKTKTTPSNTGENNGGKDGKADNKGDVKEGEKEQDNKEEENSSKSQEEQRNQLRRRHPKAFDKEGASHEPKYGRTITDVAGGGYAKNVDPNKFQPTPLDKLRILDFVKEEAINMQFDFSILPSEKDRNQSRIIDSLKTVDKTGDGQQLATTLRKLLQINSRKRWTYGKKRGKLNGKNLHRLFIKDGGGYSERIFKQRGESLTLDTAVQLIVDCSGSMIGRDKMSTAIVSAELLCQAISISLRIPVEIIGFTDTGISQFSIFKAFDIPVSNGDLRERMLKSCRSMAYNVDGEALSWAYKRLACRKEKQKMMIVLSDGKPRTSTIRGNPVEYTQKVVKEIENRSGVDITALGIMCNDIASIYSSYHVIHEVSQLEDALLTIVQNKILNGERR